MATNDICGEAAMFIDYLTLLLTNMVAGFVLLAAFVVFDLGGKDPRRWAPGFAVTGFIALAFGMHLTMTWPLPGPFNSAFGEMSVLFGALFLGASLALALGWSLISLAIYAFFAGLAAIVIGVRIIDLGLTQRPWVSGIGFILSGLGGVFAAPALVWVTRFRWLRFAAALLLLAAAAIWAVTGYASYWIHMESIRWLPGQMRGK